MAFRKRFPKDIPTSPYPQWKAVELTPDQEQDIEQNTRQEHIDLMKECLEDAKQLSDNHIQIAIALFEKRASHLAYHKEEFAYDQFLND